MKATEVIKMIGARCNEKRSQISQMSLTQWIALARQLCVPMNDRDHAAKVMALRELRAEGKLAR